MHACYKGNVTLHLHIEMLTGQNQWSWRPVSIINRLWIVYTFLEHLSAQIQKQFIFVYNRLRCCIHRDYICPCRWFLLPERAANFFMDYVYANVKAKVNTEMWWALSKQYNKSKCFINTLCDYYFISGLGVNISNTITLLIIKSCCYHGYNSA